MVAGSAAVLACGDLARLPAVDVVTAFSAASDNDPTNVGTAAAVGAQTGYQLAWVALLVAPLLGVVLAIAAQVGTVARDDLQSLALKRYGRGVAAVLLVSVVVVNLVTIAADLQAGTAGIGLLAGIGSRWLVVPLGAALAGLLLAGKYGQVVAVLRYLMLGFLAFGAAAVLAHPEWPRLLQASLVPALSLSRDQVAGALALLGTTLTSYVYMWETIGRGVEEPPDGTVDARGLARARAGVIIGAVFTAVILWCLLVASAATLGRHHQPVTSAQDAAGALRPLAGSAAAGLFAAGLITSAVVALPVLIATTAHVVGAHFETSPVNSTGTKADPWGSVGTTGRNCAASMLGSLGMHPGHWFTGSQTVLAYLVTRLSACRVLILMVFMIFSAGQPFLPRSRPQNRVTMSMQRQPWPEVPADTAGRQEGVPEGGGGDPGP